MRSLVYSALILTVVSGGFVLYSYPITEVGEHADTATILVGGDMMFDRYIRDVTDTRGSDYVFSCIKDVLASKDLALANLEGPITGNDSVSRDAPEAVPEHFRFTFPATTAELLARHNIDLVNIGNNHITNFGRDGLRETKVHLERAGVSYFGDPSESLKALRLELKGVPISFVNWNEWSDVSAEDTLELISNERTLGRIVVVYTHWGDEYVAPPERVVVLARQFIDAGAELVVGSHPHIVQESEMYKGKYIYYSLGNFIFDQYWTEEVRNGLLLEVTLGTDGIESVVEIPTYLESDGRTCLKRS